MNAEQREGFRLTLLRVLDANQTRWGLGLRALQVHAAAFGYRISDLGVFEREIQYLQDNKFCEPVQKEVSPENRAWRINAKGRDFLAEQGF